MILKRINKLKDVGIFQDFEWPNPKAFQDFKKFNVIYGWNGTGKSTLSSLLQSLGKEGSLPSKLSGSKFEILFANDEDELRINKKNLVDAPSIRVFNGDFISDYIKWEDIKADSIAYLGEKDTNRKEQLENLKIRLQKLQAKQEQETVKNEGIKNDIKKWKRDNARIIKEALTTEGRSDKYANYNISNIRRRLSDTFSNREKNYTDLLKSEDELSTIRNTIHQSRKEELKNAELRLTNLTELHDSLKEILKETVISSALDELKNNPRIERWVRNGFDIHTENDLGTCQFCGNKITDDRLSELEGHFSDTYEHFLSKIENFKKEINQATFDLDIPQRLEIDKSIQKKFQNCIEGFESLKKHFESTKQIFLNEVERKEDQLYKSLKLDVEFDGELDAKIRNKVDELNQIIDEHNQIVENFEDEIISKKEDWEKSYLAANLDGLIELEREKRDSDNYLTKMSSLIKKHNDRIEQLQDELSGSWKAASKLSEYLSQYLGRNDIQVEFDEKTKGFHFKRGEEKATNLSEGEKTGIALIYFLTKLGERDFDIENCIVVIDDPVSSLDSNSLYYAFSFIKEHCKNAKQLILLTHNFELLRRVNKWFRHENRSMFSRFMLKCYDGEKGRCSEIDKIDSLLVKYESEYHYLFKLLYQKNESEDDSLESVYNYPNITRRYLEMFFSFRAPKFTKMHSKINESVNKGAISQEQGTALQHFMNVGSHGDSEESFTSFDVNHLAKSKDAINTALELVENRDKEHYKDMVELVTKN